MKKSILTFLLFVLVSVLHAQNIQYVWDSIKNSTMPVVLPEFVNAYETPYKQPLAAYGWEDGLQISSDGLHLYAFYTPMDIVSWQTFLASNSNLPICSTIGNMSYVRPYADTYGIDLVTNPFGCDSFPNLDIVYSQRNSVNDSFVNWQLSGIPRPGAIEGGPAPLFSEEDSGQLDLFCFTGPGDIWMIQSTTANPTGIDNAIRLPTPINPETNEFIADNAFLERINGDSIILIYEKYVDAGMRDFMYTLSDDGGNTWGEPQLITTITNSLGHIEHPSLYHDPNTEEWWLYFSIDFAFIARARQTIAGNWDSWDTPENIVSKGNALSLGEPTVTKYGDISFSLAYINTVSNDSTDVYDLDPWFLPHISTSGLNHTAITDNSIQLTTQPNPFSHSTILHTNQPLRDATLLVYSAQGQEVKRIHHLSGQSILFEREGLSSGIYFIQLMEKNTAAVVDKLFIVD